MIKYFLDQLDNSSIKSASSRNKTDDTSTSISSISSSSVTRSVSDVQSSQKLNRLSSKSTVCAPSKGPRQKRYQPRRAKSERTPASGIKRIQSPVASKSRFNLLRF